MMIIKDIYDDDHHQDDDFDYEPAPTVKKRIKSENLDQMMGETN